MSQVTQLVVGFTPRQSDMETSSCQARGSMTSHDAIKRETGEAKPVTWENVDDIVIGKTSGLLNRTHPLITFVQMNASKDKRV